MFSRRFLLSALAVLPWVSAARAGTKEHAMYGLIGKFTAAEGQRDALMGYLVEGSQNMPGNQSYVVAADAGDEVTIWVTEVWDTPESHMASLKLETVQAAIAKARPLIAGMERVAETAVAGMV